MQEINLQYFMVSFLDVLGIRNGFRSLDSLPGTKHQVEKTRKTIKGTLGTIQGFRQMRDQFFDAVGAKQEFPPSVPEDIALAMNRSTEIVKYNLSDAMIVGVPFGEDGGHYPMKSAFHTFMGACQMMTIAMASGYPIRGGIDFSPAIEVEGEIYGNALSKAYELESKSAKYPRVLLGESLVQMLNETASASSGSDPEAQLAGKFAEECLSFTCLDSDGLPILDYFGKGIAAVIGKEELRDPLGKAIKFSKTGCHKFSNKGDEVLLGRYQLLLSYLQRKWESHGFDSVDS